MAVQASAMARWSMAWVSVSMTIIVKQTAPVVQDLLLYRTATDVQVRNFVPRHSRMDHESRENEGKR